MRHYANIALLVAFLCRVAVPFGFMLAPSHAAPGDVTVVICTDHGPLSVALDAEGDPAGSAKSHDSCPFAASALPAIASHAFGLPIAVAYASVTYKLAQAQFSLTPKPGATSARGPPSVV